MYANSIYIELCMQHDIYRIYIELCMQYDIYRIIYTKGKHSYLERCSSDKKAELGVEETDRLGKRRVLVLNAVSLID